MIEIARVRLFDLIAHQIDGTWNHPIDQSEVSNALPSFTVLFRLIIMFQSKR